MNLSLLLTYVLLWLFVLLIAIKGKITRRDQISIQTQYDAPREVSAVFARYILTAGKRGGRSGEISENGLQRIMLIDLYENGALKELIFVTDRTIEYEIDESYESKNLREDEILFLELLKDNVGLKASIKHSNEDDDFFSFTGIDKFWSTYWNVTLYELCIKRGYFEESSKISKFFKFIINWIAAVITLGIFFAIFALFLIPFLGPFVAILLLLPVFIIYLVLESFSSYFISILGLSSLDASIAENVNQTAFYIVIFFSWFLWIFLLGQNLNVALTPVTTKGKSIIRDINGYKDFLEKVDKDRISFTLDKDLDFKRNNTTFSWLAIFGLVTDRHWDQFYEAHSKEKRNISVSI